MAKIKKCQVLLVLALILVASVFFLFYRLYQKDVKALEDFVASYDKFDKAISDFSIGENDDLESKAGDALSELQTKAAARISSLIKNDAELMSEALKIANLAEKELDNLSACKKAIENKNADLDGLAKEHGDLSSERKTAYARFQELAGSKD